MRRAKLSEEIYGDTEYIEQEKPLFRIRISSHLDYSLAKATLIHEWAHALAHHPAAWTTERRVVEDHGAVWGVEYARVYRVVEREEERNA